ncbi:MAG: acyltransferase [Solirubrobacterales bacterium]
MDGGRDSAPVPDALAPPPHHPRYPLLDGMRAIAVLCVVGVHVGVFGVVGGSLFGKLVLHLNIGVTIFFLISGFLLYRPFIAGRTGGAEAPAIGVYARRRVLRIVPAYWLVLIVLILLPGVTAVPGGGGLEQFALVHALPIGAGPDCIRAASDCGLAQTWSLVVEFTFYALLPFYVLVAARLARGRTTASWLRAELLLLGGLTIVSLLLHFGIDGTRESMVVTGSLLGYAFWFALGMALALVSVAIADRERPPRAVAAIASRPGVSWLAAAMIYVALSLALPATPYLVTAGDQFVAHIAFGVISLLLMLPAVFAGASPGVPRTVLSNPVVAWLGLISYGIFLWHYVVTIELGLPGEGWSFLPLLIATLAISIPIAAASYYLLERPLLRFKYR